MNKPMFNRSGVRFCPTAIAWSLGCILLLVSSPRAAASYYDWQDIDRKAAYDLLEQVEADVGSAEYDNIPQDLAFAFALPLCRIDRYHITSSAILGHLKCVTQARGRFYQAQKGLSDAEVMAWLLPLRIRYESTSKPDWMVRTASKFEPVTAQATTADDAAEAILTWMTTNLDLIDPTLSYRLPLRGDLDPLSVLKGGRGTEIDLAICGVAALRASGVAARIVWAPAMRGQPGGKVWLEYLDETKAWQPWVPSLRRKLPHREAFRKEHDGKFVFVMARPEEPVEITAHYADTVEIEFRPEPGEVNCSLMVLGSEGLLPARGNGVEMMKNERVVTIGKGPVIAVASFGNSSFALLPVEAPSPALRILIHAAEGKLWQIESESNPTLEGTQSDVGQFEIQPQIPPNPSP